MHYNFYTTAVWIFWTQKFSFEYWRLWAVYLAKCWCRSVQINVWEILQHFLYLACLSSYYVPKLFQHYTFNFRAKLYLDSHLIPTCFGDGHHHHHHQERQHHRPKRTAIRCFFCHAKQFTIDLLYWRCKYKIWHWTGLLQRWRYRQISTFNRPKIPRGWV